MIRPTFLIIMLVWIFLSSLYSLYSYFLKGNLLVALFNIPSWVPTVSALCSTANLISVVLLSVWKRIGFYIILGSAVITVILNIVFLRGFGIIVAVLSLIVVGVLYLAIRPVWSSFR